MLIAILRLVCVYVVVIVWCEPSVDFAKLWRVDRQVFIIHFILSTCHAWFFNAWLIMRCGLALDLTNDLLVQLRHLIWRISEELPVHLLN